jgi:hypothetical protein
MSDDKSIAKIMQKQEKNSKLNLFQDCNFAVVEDLFTRLLDEEMATPDGKD